MRVAAHPSPKLTAEEYSRLPEVNGMKDELIEGERVLAPGPSFRILVLDNLESLLKKQFPDMRIVREAGWRFRLDDGSDNVPGPDLMVIAPDDYYQAARSHEYFQGQPRFVIEVISPTERKSRRMQKVGLYLEAGAGAVVEVDYTRRCAYIYRPEEDAPVVVRDKITFPFNATLDEILRQTA